MARRHWLPHNADSHFQYFQNMREYIQQNYLQLGIAELKKRVAFYTNIPRLTADTAFNEFISNKTGYVFNVFEGLEERISKIINRGRIVNKNERYDVQTMMVLCEKGVADAQLIPALKQVQELFYEKRELVNAKRRKSTEKNKRNHHSGNNIITVTEKYLDTNSQEKELSLIIQEESNSNLLKLTKLSIVLKGQEKVLVYAAKGRNSRFQANIIDDQNLTIKISKRAKSFIKKTFVEFVGKTIDIEYVED